MEKRFFSQATSAGHNKTLYAELAKLKDKRTDAKDRKTMASLDQQIATMEKMIESDSTLQGIDEDQMEQELDVARGKENEALAEMEFIKDKIKKQACISILKLVKFMSDELGPPGYFALWKGVWFKRKTAVRMDDDDPEAPSSGAVDELAVRKISKLQWLVREMKQERDEMWSEMASLMAMLREFEAEKASLQSQLTELNKHVSRIEEERQMLCAGMEKMNDRVDQYVAGQ